MDLVRRQVDVLAVQDLGHDSPLRGHPPSASAQPFQKVAHTDHLNSKRNSFRTGVTLEPDLTWTMSNIGSTLALTKEQERTEVAQEAT
ncbi:hypothetical protein GCM10010508_34600 [Streptomyces naganishii JCM 4654]|uniref:Uncharacterized protein n=1 Tax=Streptomyces naganishii JCM 4654 TaxID=1306179 RepID=A0A918Y538_9ACTN|nr:hypothetical protein GCM10010508_34600 [Streptomyces naganishii JCM 4654]